jgi:hypothetical protein
MIIIKNRNTTYLQDKYKLNEGFSTMATGLLSFWRWIGVIVSGFVCDFIGLKLQIVFFTFTMFLSMGSWAVIGIWEEVPLYGFLICISSYSLFVSPTYYLAGQFFSVIFGGAKHCGFLDGLKGNLFLKNFRWCSSIVWNGFFVCIRCISRTRMGVASKYSNRAWFIYINICIFVSIVGLLCRNLFD